MQPRGRGRDAAVVLRINGLVALAVIGSGRTLDIWWKGNFSVAREGAARGERSDEPHPSQPASLYFDDFNHAVFTDRDSATGFEFPTWMHHGEPCAVRQFANEQHLCGTARFSLAVQSRGDDAGFVDDEHIRRREEINDRGKRCVTNRAARALEHQETAGRAVGQGMLRDVLRRECVIEV